MPRSRVWCTTDRNHWTAHGELNHGLERHLAAVDDRESPRNSGGFDRLAIVAAEGRTAIEMEYVSTSADREMTAFGLKCAGDQLVCAVGNGGIHRRVSRTT